jgi:hypothetical protein
MAFLSLFRAVSLSPLVCNSCTGTTPSLVLTVSRNVAKLVALVASPYLGISIEGLDVKVLSLKDYSTLTRFLCCYYTV